MHRASEPLAFATLSNATGIGIVLAGCVAAARAVLRPWVRHTRVVGRSADQQRVRLVVTGVGTGVRQIQVRI